MRLEDRARLPLPAARRLGGELPKAGRLPGDLACGVAVPAAERRNRLRVSWHRVRGRQRLKVGRACRAHRPPPAADAMPAPAPLMSAASLSSVAMYVRCPWLAIFQTLCMEASRSSR